LVEDHAAVATRHKEKIFVRMDFAILFRVDFA